MNTSKIEARYHIVTCGCRPFYSKTLAHAILPSMKALALAFLALTAGLSLRAATVVAEPFPPARFTSLYIERDEKGAVVAIQEAGDSVTYKVTLGNKVLENLTVHPTDDDWFKFIQALNQAKVYRWTSKYYYPGQGPTWVIDLTMDDRKFYSEGTNEYPKNGDETQGQANPASGPSVPFQLFWQAVLGLVGKISPPPPPK